MEMAKVTSKGQITIPVSIRRRLDIKEGDKLLFMDKPDGVLMVNPGALPVEQAVAAQRDTSTVREKPRAENVVEEPPLSQTSQKEIEAKPEAVIEATKPKVVTETSLPEKENVAALIKEETESPAPKPNEFNWDTLLDEIRSIGSKI